MSNFSVFPCPHPGGTFFAGTLLPVPLWFWPYFLCLLCENCPRLFLGIFYLQPWPAVNRTIRTFPFQLFVPTPVGSSPDQGEPFLVFSKLLRSLRDHSPRSGSRSRKGFAPRSICTLEGFCPLFVFLSKLLIVRFFPTPRWYFSFSPPSFSWTCHPFQFPPPLFVFWSLLLNFSPFIK